jgi:hypothetical protein
MRHETRKSTASWVGGECVSVTEITTAGCDTGTPH